MCEARFCCSHRKYQCLSSPIINSYNNNNYNSIYENKNVNHISKVPDNTCFVLNINSVGLERIFQEMLYRTTKLNLVNKRNDFFLIWSTAF